ncbi:MAG TPA: hypothetical protein VFQ39_03110 [Longimicrobium sp.]|nr:hypothetical protein [Longimicrobium sp.]
MDDVDHVVELLRELHPHECAFIGEAAVREIAAGPVEVVRAEHGSNLDLTQIILLVAATATGLNQGLALILALRKTLGRNPTVEEVEMEVAARPPNAFAALAPEVRRKLIRSLEERGALRELPYSPVR